MIWREEGGPPVTPPTRRGFGVRLIEQALGGDPSGTVHLDFAPSGLVCRIEATVGRQKPE
jgi:two-component sensor histidine kinase